MTLTPDPNPHPSPSPNPNPDPNPNPNPDPTPTPHRAQRLVGGLLAKPPSGRLTAAQLMSNSWIRGENVPERPMPEAVERLRVFQKATTAILP